MKIEMNEAVIFLDKLLILFINFLVMRVFYLIEWEKLIFYQRMISGPYVARFVKLPRVCYDW